MLIERVPLFLGYCTRFVSHCLCMPRDALAFIHFVRWRTVYSPCYYYCDPLVCISTISCWMRRITIRVPIYQSRLLSSWTSYCDDMLTWSMHRAYSRISCFYILKLSTLCHMRYCGSITWTFGCMIGKPRSGKPAQHGFTCSTASEKFGAGMTSGYSCVGRLFCSTTALRCQFTPHVLVTCRRSDLPR